jgi:hypothetical protein
MKVFTEREKPVKVFWKTKKKVFGEKPFPMVLQKTFKRFFTVMKTFQGFLENL